MEEVLPEVIRPGWSRECPGKGVHTTMDLIISPPVWKGEERETAPVLLGEEDNGPTDHRTTVRKRRERKEEGEGTQPSKMALSCHTEYTQEVRGIMSLGFCF